MTEQASALSAAFNKDPRDIILGPVVSEKSYGLIDEGKYTFYVDTRASKTEIKLAIEKIFGVKVAGVNTLNRVGKARRTRFGTGKRKDTKRAIVTLKAGTIDIFTAVG
jgi:large subunit ribosomal protein L23